MRARALALVAIVGCGTTVRYRAEVSAGDQCGRSCARERGGDEYAECVRACPGLAREVGGCSEARPGPFCAEFREGGHTGLVVAAVVLGLVSALIFLGAAASDPG
jgi:hypothetical protein